MVWTTPPFLLPGTTPVPVDGLDDIAAFTVLGRQLKYIPFSKFHPATARSPTARRRLGTLAGLCVTTADCWTAGLCKPTVCVAFPVGWWAGATHAGTTSGGRDRYGPGLDLSHPPPTTTTLLHILAGPIWTVQVLMDAHNYGPQVVHYTHWTLVERSAVRHVVAGIRTRSPTPPRSRSGRWVCIYQRPGFPAPPLPVYQRYSTRNYFHLPYFPGGLPPPHLPRRHAHHLPGLDVAGTTAFSR